MTTSPAADRLAAAQGTPSGWVVPSGLSEFRKAVSGADGVQAFGEWRKSRFTQLLFLALQDAILHPGVVEPADVPVQFGVTQGLAFAAQLVSDPSVLWPNAFGPGMENARQKPHAPPERFSASPDGGGTQTNTTRK